MFFRRTQIKKSRTGLFRAARGRCRFVFCSWTGTNLAWARIGQQAVAPSNVVSADRSTCRCQDLKWHHGSTSKFWDSWKMQIDSWKVQIGRESSHQALKMCPSCFCWLFSAIPLLMQFCNRLPNRLLIRESNPHDHLSRAPLIMRKRLHM